MATVKVDPAVADSLIRQATSQGAAAHVHKDGTLILLSKSMIQTLVAKAEEVVEDYVPIFIVKEAEAKKYSDVEA